MEEQGVESVESEPFGFGHGKIHSMESFKKLADAFEAFTVSSSVSISPVIEPGLVTDRHLRMKLRSSIGLL